jgi:hypothetical protein
MEEYYNIYGLDRMRCLKNMILTRELLIGHSE